jgi:D-inositol-3-phosphate glycosyltransferase
MRIAMISEHASPLGAGAQASHVAELSGALAEEGHEVRV